MTQIAVWLTVSDDSEKIYSPIFTFVPCILML